VQTNPYAAPAASVADPQAPSAGFAPARIWTLEGRIGRLRLIAYGIGGVFLLNLCFGILAALAAFAGAKSLMGIVMVLSYIGYAAMYILLAVRRAHDLDWSGYLGLLAIVPLVNLVFVFLPGSKGANRYGLPPPPNGWGIRALAMFFPAIALIGILAAIAIPAYQGYAMRALQSRAH
jgi:uncharacterized membrane protein YhaH (DUF805 family)